METRTKSKYFRISLTESCNLNCYFCHNEGQERGKGTGAFLTAEDITWIAKAAAGNGYIKFKLTGGEPSKHPEILSVIAGISSVGVGDLSMITNGYRLKELASQYRKAGLHRLNISLYTLDADKFRRNNGGGPAVLRKIIDGIDEAIRVGYKNIKLNYVWDGTENLDDFLRVCDFASERNLTVVLLPVMKFRNATENEETELTELYDVLRKLGIKCEKQICDAEGIVKNLIELKNGAKVLLRKEELKEKYPYSHCRVCNNRAECREGIFPTRLSARGKLHPCLADRGNSIDIMDAIKARSSRKVNDAFTTIREM